MARSSVSSPTPARSLAGDHWLLALASGTILLAFALRLYRLDAASLWWDESYGVALGQRPLGAVLFNTTEFHPPLYYTTLYLWMRGAGQSEFAVRFLSLAWNLITVALLYLAGRRLFDRRSGLAAAFVAALSALYLAYSQEVRMYSMETALGLASVLGAWSLTAGRPIRLHSGSRRGVLRWVIYVAATVAALYTDYFAALVLLFENVFVTGWLITRILRRQPWLGTAVRWAGSQLVILVLFSPWLGVALGLRGYGGPQATSLRIRSLLEQVWTGFNLGSAAPLEVAAPHLWFSAAVLVAGLALSLWDRRLASLALTFLYVLVPVAAFVIATRSRPFFHVRYLLVATPGYYLLLGVALASLWRTRRMVGLLVAVVLLIGWGMGIGSYLFNPVHAKPGARQAGAFLSGTATAGDLLFWPPDHPLAYYYRGSASRGHFKVAPATAADQLTHLAQGYRRVFWEASDLVDNDPWGVVPFLLEKDAHPEGSQGFPGYQLRWYSLPAEPHFTLGDLAPTAVNFEDELALTGAAFGNPRDLAALPADRRPWVVLQWQSRGPVGGPRKFFVHLLDQAGRLVGQADSPLLDERRLTTQFWAPGTVALAFANPPLLAGLTPGRYRLEVGVYDAESGRRLGIVGGRAGTFTLGELNVARPERTPSLAALGLARTLGWNDGKMELLGLGGSLAPSRLDAGQAVDLTLYWRVGDSSSSPPPVRLWLQDTQGQRQGEVQIPVAAGYPPAEWQPGEVLRDVLAYRPGPQTTPGEYRLLLAWGSQEIDIMTLSVQGRGRVYTLPDALAPVGAQFAGGVELAGFKLEREPVPAGESLALILYWRGGEADGVSWTVFVHLLDEQNRIWAQHDGLPAGGGAPTTGWLPGEVIPDRHEMVVKADAPEGLYDLEVGLYDLRTGERRPLENGEDRVVLGKVRIIR